MDIVKLTQAQLAHIKTLEIRGRITAKRLLADARKPSSPLHSLPVFHGWDAKHATEKWWLHCCRLIIGAVTVQVTHNHTVLKSPVYVVDTSVKGEGYRSIVSMKNDPAAARESLIYTLETAAGHLRRAYDLAAPLGLTKEIDALLAQIAGVARIVAKKAA
jgi:hypothetical protein